MITHRDKEVCFIRVLNFQVSYHFILLVNFPKTLSLVLTKHLTVMEDIQYKYSHEMTTNHDKYLEITQFIYSTMLMTRFTSQGF